MHKRGRRTALVEAAGCCGIVMSVLLFNSASRALWLSESCLPAPQPLTADDMHEQVRCT